MNTQLDTRHFFPQVYQAVPTDRFEVYAYMNDGSVRMIDMKPLLRPGTVFDPLRDIDTFKRLLTVMNGTVAWDIGGGRDETACLDLDPVAIFDGPPVVDPLDTDMEAIISDNLEAWKALAE